MRNLSSLGLLKICLLVFLLTTVSVSAQQQPTEKPAVIPKQDQQNPTTPSTPLQKTIKPYKEVITAKAKTNKGLFTVHKLDDKYYFEISDSLMKREFIAVTRYRLEEHTSEL